MYILLSKIKNKMIWLLCIISFASCAQNNSTKMTESNMDKNILIVYLSRTKNTKAIAEIIQKNVGGDLLTIELEEPYPEDYQTTVDQVAKENETGYLPPLKTKIENIESYDVIFIGFPTWGMQLPPPIKSFLNENNLRGKTVIPFNTHAGFGVGSGFRQIKELCSASKVLEGLSLEGGYEKKGIYLAIKEERKEEAEKEVKMWLQKAAFLIDK